MKKNKKIEEFNVATTTLCVDLDKKVDEMLEFALKVGEAKMLLKRWSRAKRLIKKLNLECFSMVQSLENNVVTCFGGGETEG